MLHVPHPINFVDGREFGRRLRKLSARERAAAAIALESGETRLSNLTRAQSAALARVSTTTIARTQHPLRPPTDAAIERAVTRLGPDRVLRALNRMTAPEFPKQTQLDGETV